MEIIQVVQVVVVAAIQLVAAVAVVWGVIQARDLFREERRPRLSARYLIIDNVRYVAFLNSGGEVAKDIQVTWGTPETGSSDIISLASELKELPALAPNQELRQAVPGGGPEVSRIGPFSMTLEYTDSKDTPYYDEWTIDPSSMARHLTVTVRECIDGAREQ